ncbi:MAG: hypothetical protein ABIN97_20340 [Ginsengibacter sp.]
MRLIYILPSLIFLLFAFERCTTKEKFSYSIPSLDSTITPKKISITQLVNQYKSLDGQYIETEGTYFSAFEEFAIYTDKKFLSNERDGFWMDVNKNLVTDNKDWNRIDKKQGAKILIRGRVDTASHGHLHGYLSTITNIYFFKEN